MSRIVRWDPFRDMVAMRNQMDQVMNEWLKASGTMENGDHASAMRLALDIVENENAFVVKASVPGLNPEDLDISFAENTLTVQGEIREETTNASDRFHLRERRFGHFTRSVNLPVGVKADDIDAQYENGVLVLTLPKAEETKPRKISVRSHNGDVVNA